MVVHNLTGLSGEIECRTPDLQQSNYRTCRTPDLQHSFMLSLSYLHKIDTLHELHDSCSQGVLKVTQGPEDMYLCSPAYSSTLLPSSPIALSDGCK
jgi:hypothetical protein